MYLNSVLALSAVFQYKTQSQKLYISYISLLNLKMTVSRGLWIKAGVRYAAHSWSANFATVEACIQNHKWVCWTNLHKVYYDIDHHPHSKATDKAWWTALHVLWRRGVHLWVSHCPVLHSNHLVRIQTYMYHCFQSNNTPHYIPSHTLSTNTVKTNWNKGLILLMVCISFHSLATKYVLHMLTGCGTVLLVSWLRGRVKELWACGCSQSMKKMSIEICLQSRWMTSTIWNTHRFHFLTETGSLG